MKKFSKTNKQTHKQNDMDAKYAQLNRQVEIKEITALELSYKSIILGISICFSLAFLSRLSQSPSPADWYKLSLYVDMPLNTNESYMTILKCSQF